MYNKTLVHIKVPYKEFESIELVNKKIRAFIRKVYLTQL